MTDKVRLIAGEYTWIEGEAVSQLHAQAARSDMRATVGFPDMQPGKGSPSGAAFVSDLIIPQLVGSDVGCGIGLWTTDYPIRKAKIAKLKTRLDGLDHPWDGDTTAFLAERGIAPTAFDASLGTPGHGNHFIELQQIVKIHDESLAANLNLTPDTVKIVVHSGSRGFGEAIFIEYAVQYGADGFAADSDDGRAYLAKHNHAFMLAKANRLLCAERVLDALNCTGDLLLDITHNAVVPFIHEGCSCWLHRKGAAPADCGPVVIPGSRDDLTYIVMPIAPAEALASLAHGAGRKIARKEAHGKLERLYPNKDKLKRNQWGGEVICGDAPLLWQEAKECYKDIATVINDLEAAGLIKCIASLRPLVTFKTSEIAKEEQRRDRETWQRERSKARADKGKR